LGGGTGPGEEEERGCESLRWQESMLSADATTGDMESCERKEMRLGEMR
jgi:hypothetical protein